MCLLFVALRHFEKCPLVIAFNRDESVNRPARPAHFWDDYPDILAGRDAMRGGTWGGISRSGKMAFITFVRRPEPWMPSPTPRSEIVPQFLKSTESPEKYINHLKMHRTEYLGFNVVCGSVEGLWYYSNVTDLTVKLEPGIHGIGNAFLNTPWPKVVRGTSSIMKLQKDGEVTTGDIFRILADEERANSSDVPIGTGLSDEKEWQRSSIFVNSPGYATRCSTVVVVRGNGIVEFYERSFQPSQGEVSFVV